VSSTKKARSHSSRKLTIKQRPRFCVYVPLLGTDRNRRSTGGATIVCPLHERAYDLRTGAGLNGEATRLKVYPAALDEDGTIWVTLGK
jgi:nitrite reductase/ring-hydroxylating ferredoxin subunit